MSRFKFRDCIFMTINYTKIAMLLDITFITVEIIKYIFCLILWEKASSVSGFKSTCHYFFTLYKFHEKYV